jgi:CopG family transcriptional regulator, nickel-responsive regulator
MTSKVVRLGVSLEPELVALLDRWVRERNSPSRSDGLRALIRKELAERTLADPESDALGVIALLYRHDAPNVMQRLTAAEHRWGEHVRSTTHVHLEGDACAEVVVLLGRRREVEAAAGDLGGVRGVLAAESVVTSPGVAGGRTGHRHPHPAVAGPH